MIELLNIDCMDFLKSAADKSFDLAILDTPYGIEDDGRNHRGRVFKKDGSRILKKDPRNGSVIKIKPQKYKLDSGYDNGHPDQEYFDHVFRVTKNQIIFGENYISFNQKDTSSGRIIWDKVNGETDQSDCELAWTSCHSSVRMFSYMWNGMLQGISATEGRVSQGNRALCEERIHPNHKPVILYKWLLKNYAKPGDKILDTHGGGMSIAIAAHDYKFDLTICEKDKDHFNAGLKRFNNHKSQQTLF